MSHNFYLPFQSGISSVIDSDGTLTPASDTVIPSQLAVITYVTNSVKITEHVLTTSVALTEAQCRGGLINTYGLASNIIFTLPTAVSGLFFEYVAGSTAAFYVRFLPTSSNIYLDSQVGGANKYAYEATIIINDSIYFETFKTGASSYSWRATSGPGTWLLEA